MGKRWTLVILALVVFVLTSVGASAAGVFIVSRAGVTPYNGAMAGFMQVAYANQLPGFDPKSIQLQGTSADDAALSALKAKLPTLIFTVGSYATKKVRAAIPDVWIVYAMVYYPDLEGFTADPKMVGIGSLGSPKDLNEMVKAFRRRAKRLYILHSPAIQSSIPGLIAQLDEAGFDAQDKPVPDAPSLQGVFNSIRDDAQVVLLLPDPLTSNQDALRYIISQCVDNKIIPVALSDSLVANGALCAAFYPGDAVGNEAAKVAQTILNTGKAPADKVVDPPSVSTSVNMKTAQALRLKVPSKINFGVTYE